MAENKIPYKIYLDESEIPTKWYNVRADMKNKPAPLLNPATLKPMTHADLAPVFCDELIDQELIDLEYVLLSTKNKPCCFKTFNTAFIVASLLVPEILRSIRMDC